MLSDNIRQLMVEVARHQLRLARRHARETDPARIASVTTGPDGRRVRRLIAAQNIDSNQRLERFWRAQIARYTP